LLGAFAACVLVAPQGIGVTLAQAQQGRLSAVDVIKMVQEGQPEESTVGKIKAAKRRFQFTDREKEQLKQRGVTDLYISYMENPDLPYPPSSKLTGAVAPPTENIYSDDAFAAKVPAGIGAYLLQKSSLSPIEVKSLAPDKQGGFIVPLPLGLGSAKIIGALPGAAAPVRVESTPAVFYLRLAENTKIEDVTIIVLDAVAKEKRRQAEFTPSQQKDGKPSPKATLLRQSERTAVGPRLYRVVTTQLGTGEFMFYLGGSADPAKGTLGKGYDFGVN
jgi:hypothetical protein